MGIAKAIALSGLVPLLGVGVLGIGVGYRSIVGLGQFVLLWAIFLYPLVTVATLAFYFLSRRLGLTARWHFALGGLVGGTILAFGWLSPGPLLPVSLFGVAGGAVGAGTMVVFWHLALGARRLTSECS